MESNLLEEMMKYADEGDKNMVKRIVKVLEANNICSLQHLMCVEGDILSGMKGISDRSLCVIGRITTKYKYELEKKAEAYNKMKGNIVVKDFRYYAQKCGASKMEAYNMERALKNGGLKTFEDFMNASEEELSQIRGIGTKRLQRVIEIKSMYSKDHKKARK